MIKKIGALVISVMLAAAILGIMLYRVWDDLLDTLRYIEPLYLIPAIIICLTAWFVRGGRYASILKSLKIEVSLLFSTACIYLSQAVNFIIPARLGDLIRVVLIRHDYEATVSQGISSIVVERIFDIITVAFLGLISILFVLNVPDWMISLIIIPLLLGGVFFVLIIYMNRLKSDNKYLMYILTMVNEVKTASLTPKSLVLLIISSIVIWLLDSSICLCVADMFEQQIPIPVIILAIVAGNLVKAVPLTPGGMGTYELSLALIFEASGVAPAVATLIAVIDHLIKNLITLFGGVASIFYFGNWVIPEVTNSIKKRLTERTSDNS
jgi:glycosyltransferase AglD